MTTKRNLLHLTALCLVCTGCNHAPSIDVIGSFFPVWMLCLIIGIIFTFIVRYVLIRYQLESEVGNLTLFYPGVVVLLTCLLWLLFFR